MSFLVLKRISGNSEEDQYFILLQLKPKMGDYFYKPDSSELKLSL